MSARRDLELLRRLQRLLSEGEFVATYKFALLQALADLSVERRPAVDGRLALPVRDIAEKFIEAYWRQVVPYGAVETDRAVVLQQNHGSQAAIVNHIVAAQDRLGSSMADARMDRQAWATLVTKVARTIRQQPLWKLQIIAGSADEVLYRRDDFENDQIILLSGVADFLRSFHGLVTNMVRGGWLGQVRRIQANAALLGNQGDLEEFMFGTERRNLEAYRGVLRAHQRAKCFYCGREVRGTGDADHFIPWARYPVDLGHNFVFSHPGCNNAKRDYLAHADHLARWREENLVPGGELTDRLADQGLPHDRGRTLAIARWAYEQGHRHQAHWWLKGKEIEPVDGRWLQALAPVAMVAEPPPEPYRDED